MSQMWQQETAVLVACEYCEFILFQINAITQRPENSLSPASAFRNGHVVERLLVRIDHIIEGEQTIFCRKYEYLVGWVALGVPKHFLEEGTGVEIRRPGSERLFALDARQEEYLLTLAFRSVCLHGFSSS